MSKLAKEDVSNSDQHDRVAIDEVGRLRSLCLKLLNEHNDGQGGERLSQVQSEGLKQAIRGAWAELSRKQAFLEHAVEKLSEFEILNASLHEAWAELERKQFYLEAAVTDARKLKEQLAALEFDS